MYLDGIKILDGRIGIFKKHLIKETISKIYYYNIIGYVYTIDRE